ncbi:MAG: alpha/beta fold hydrolase, partial [Gaiellales bacterium]
AFRATLAANDAESYARLAEIVADIDLAGELAGVTAPVLLLGGDLDGPSPPSLNRANAERLPRATHTELPGCGHIAPLERPDSVLEAILAFLRREELAAPS